MYESHHNIIHAGTKSALKTLTDYKFSNPWLQIELIRGIAEYFGSSVWVIEHVGAGETISIGVLFHEKKNGLNVLYSGGRFGFLGFESLNSILCNNKCLDQLLNELVSYELDAISIKWKDTTRFENKIKSKNRMVFHGERVIKQYYIAILSETIADGNLLFQSGTRRMLNRNLRSSQKHNYEIKITTNSNVLKNWFINCHLQRMRELNSNGWDLRFFRLLESTGKGILFYVVSAGNIVGGCFCIKSETDLELIMMSTPDKDLKKSLNYFLTYEIYKWAELNELRLVNWQASNPPSGGVAKFKQTWNAKVNDIYVYCFKKDSINITDLKTNFPDRYIFPYSSENQLNSTFRR
jgi:hypothetical protein